MSQDLIRQYTNQITYFIGEIKDKKLKDKYKKRLKEIVQTNNEFAEIDLIALINEIERHLNVAVRYEK